MKIKFYGYNAFLIESGDKKIAIDPGALFFYWFQFATLIPKSNLDQFQTHRWRLKSISSPNTRTIITPVSVLVKKTTWRP